MHKLTPIHLAYLLPLILNLLITIKPAEAEVAPSAINEGTSNISSHATKLRDGAIEKATAYPQQEQVPRSLKEAGFPNQLILSAPNPVAQTTEPRVLAAPPDTPTPNLYVSPHVGGSFTTGPGVGYESSFGGVEGFVPLSQTPGQNLAFLQGRMLLSTDNAQLGGNVVLGYRTYRHQNNRILGGHLSYDIRDTGRSTFNQVGLGLESLGEVLDFRVNGYIPVGNTRQKVEDNSFSTSSFTPQVPTFQDNFLAIGILNQVTQLNRRFEAALGGLDAEVGVKIARIGEIGALRGYGGLYYYDGPGTAGIAGVRGRLEARPTDNFQVGLLVQSDGKFGTNVVFSVAANFPGTRPKGAVRQDEVVARLGDGVTRQENIVVDQQQEIGPVNSTAAVAFATNPATNQPYFFQHVNLGFAEGNGKFESPFGTVQNALNATRSDGNDIVYVQIGSNPGIPAFTIPNNAQVLSTGPVQVISTVERGNVQLPLSGAGVLPTVLPSGGNVPGVTVGNNTTLSGFAINNATDVGIGNEGSAGTGSNPIDNVTIRNNQVAGSGTDGIRLTNMTGAINLFNNIVTNSETGDGIRIANTIGQANITITGNNTTENTRAGIAILLNDTAQATSTISGNAISDNGFIGILLRLSGNSQATATISGNIISGNRVIAAEVFSGGRGVNGLTFDNSILRLLIDSNLISDNVASGIFLQAGNSSNIFSTVSNNTLTNNSTNPGAASDVGAIGNFVAQSIGDNSTFCLDLANNTSSNSNPASADFNFSISPNGPPQFLFTASGNTPGTINFLSFTPGFPPADPVRFTTPLGNCVVP
jgi:hypothetical protein